MTFVGTRPQIRIARPVTDLARTVAMYTRGLGLQPLGRFENHAGFDGVMLGHPDAEVHFEFTVCHHHPVTPRSTPEDLVVFYLPERARWEAACADLTAAGFVEVTPFNPYWAAHGRTYTDADGYRIVLQCATWTPD